MSMSKEHAKRTERYGNVISPARLAKLRVSIVGVGAVGRQSALMLAAMGVQFITLWDHDEVDEVNMGTQGYRPDQVGEPKVRCTASDIMAINPEVTLQVNAQKFDPDLHDTHDVVMLCVDSMEARAQVVDATEGTKTLVIDHRMGAQQWILWPVYDDRTRERWREAWFPDSEADEAPCGYQSTYFCAANNASAGISMMTRYLNDDLLPDELHCNVQSDMLMEAIYQPVESE